MEKSTKRNDKKNNIPPKEDTRTEQLYEKWLSLKKSCMYIFLRKYVGQYQVCATGCNPVK